MYVRWRWKDFFRWLSKGGCRGQVKRVERRGLWRGGGVRERCSGGGGRKSRRGSMVGAGRGERGGGCREGREGGFIESGMVKGRVHGGVHRRWFY
jgi:hypothetical protein